MTEFVWHIGAQSVNDVHALEWAKEAFENGGGRVYFCQEILVEAIRVHMIRNNIPCTDAVFIFDGKEIAINKRYEVESWPKGFGDTHKDLLRELIEWRRSNCPYKELEY